MDNDGSGLLLNSETLQAFRRLAHCDHFMGPARHRYAGKRIDPINIISAAKIEAGTVPRTRHNTIAYFAAGHFHAQMRATINDGMNYAINSG